MHIFFCGLLSVFLVIPEAHAYLDPGSGGMLLQLLLGGLAGAFAIVKLYFAQLKQFFGKLVGKKEK